MVARKFSVLLEPADEGGFVVKCLELPVASEGETKKEALGNIKEAVEGYLEVKAKLLDRKSVTVLEKKLKQRKPNWN